MKRLSAKLSEQIKRAEKRLKSIPLEDWETTDIQGKWTRKEVLGHLIDSAANNHQRLVRVQYEDNPVIMYNQNNWVIVQNYKDTEIENTINLFVTYNMHLAHIISNIAEEDAERRCIIGEQNQVTLKWLVRDYINHLAHHLKQI